MDIYDERTDTFICNSEKDLEKYAELQNTGNLVEKQRVKRHHEAIPGKELKVKTVPKTVYFTDKTSYSFKDENDPHIGYDEQGLPVWVPLDDDRTFFGMDIVTEVEQERSDPVPEWDEMEPILSWTPFSKQELLQIEEDKKVREIIQEAPAFLDSLKSLDKKYGENSQMVIDMNNQLNTLLFYSAENIGYNDEGYASISTVEEQEQKVNNMQYGITNLTLAFAEMIGGQEQ